MAIPNFFDEVDACVCCSDSFLQGEVWQGSKPFYRAMRLYLNKAFERLDIDHVFYRFEVVHTALA